MSTLKHGNQRGSPGTEPGSFWSAADAGADQLMCVCVQAPSPPEAAEAARRAEAEAVAAEALAAEARARADRAGRAAAAQAQAQVQQALLAQAAEEAAGELPCRPLVDMPSWRSGCLAGVRRWPGCHPTLLCRHAGAKAARAAAAAAEYQAAVTEAQAAAAADVDAGLAGSQGAPSRTSSQTPGRSLSWTCTWTWAMLRRTSAGRSQTCLLQARCARLPAGNCCKPDCSSGLTVSASWRVALNRLNSGAEDLCEQ